MSLIDWDNPDAVPNAPIWRIPASRVKLHVEDKGNPAFGHDVPLSHQAVEVLRALRPLTGGLGLLFPSSKTWREPMSDAALSIMYKRMAGGRYKHVMVPHGWRSSFSTIMNERAAELEGDGDRMVIDMVLAHVPAGCRHQNGLITDPAIANRGPRLFRFGLTSSPAGSIRHMKWSAGI
ncbi:integrase [Sphingobium xenophagum]|uniref:Integrase n=1 Tax=Sphingobium xenophagum TaxID=121428 RepID=A0ABU1WX72_SPHXE|nr:hypothetical protein [Sphingobium xenophagum]MDR7153912.1 integrase [Sphingobium xenophagum]